ncbi:putative transporter protein SLAC1/Mae1/ Ssu1/TehA [Helianthus anomalus]
MFIFYKLRYTFSNNNFHVSRPNLFKKSMKKFNVVWWAYSYPLTVLALASTEYAQEMKTGVAHLLMIILSGLSVLVSFILMVYTALNTSGEA